MSPNGSPPSKSRITEAHDGNMTLLAAYVNEGALYQTYPFLCDKTTKMNRWHATEGKGTR